MTPDQKIILARVIGALPGLAFAGLSGFQYEKSKKESLKKMKENLVPAVKTVKEIAPEIKVITSKKELSKINLPKSQKQQLEYPEIKKDIESSFKGLNSLYILAGKKPIIAAPSMVNKSIIGHEIGHHIDRRKNKWTILDAVIQSRRERRAWEASPFQSEQDKIVAKTTLDTYKNFEKMMYGGLGAIAGAIAAPYILKAIKK